MISKGSDTQFTSVALQLFKDYQIDQYPALTMLLLFLGNFFENNNPVSLLMSLKFLQSYQSNIFLLWWMTSHSERFTRST